MSTGKLTRHSLHNNNNSNVTSSGNSLDWDSPSTVTGTVKRRPISGSSDCDYLEEKYDSDDKGKHQQIGGAGRIGDGASVLSEFGGTAGRKRKPRTLKTSGIPRGGFDVGLVGW